MFKLQEYQKKTIARKTTGNVLVDAIDTAGKERQHTNLGSCVFTSSRTVR